MSKHGVGHAHTSVVFDIQTKTIEEIQDLYGIQIDDDGVVYDPCEMEEFESLTAWAAYMDVEANQDAQGFEKRGGKQYYDDD